MSKDPERYMEWLELGETKEFMRSLEALRLEKLEAIIVNPNREEGCGIVKGISLVQSLMESAKKEEYDRREE